MSTQPPRLEIIDSGATAEEVAAILAAVGAITAQAVPAVTDAPDGRESRWVRMSRRSAIGADAMRSEWRFSGRAAGRTRA